MNKKAQVLMIFLWILVILTIMAVSIGQRTLMALKFSRYQKDRLKALYLAEAGINRAIAEIEKDDQNYDSLKDKWADNEEVFKKTVLGDNENEFATVSYTIKDDIKTEIKFGIVDEERKININRIDSIGQKQLLEIFKFADIVESEAEELKNTVVDWIDDDIEPEEKKKFFKNSPLKIPEELLIILEYFYRDKGEEKYQEKAGQIYDKIKNLITTYADNNKVNINTASEEVLLTLANSVAENQDERNCVESVVKEIIKQIEEKNYFKMMDNIEIKDVVSGTSSDENLFTNLKDQLTIKSNYFRIESTGNIDRTTKKITVVVKRSLPVEIVYWHEN